MSASRSRQKRKLEPISIEELAGTTGMSGFCTFLTRDSQIAVPALDHIDSSAPEISAPLSIAPEIIEPQPTGIEETALDFRYGIVTSASETTAPNTSAAEASAERLRASEPSAPEVDASDFRYRRRPRIREAHTVQDGHSLAEQAVYEAMYGAGKPYRDESRILTIGLRTLAEISRMAYSNCKANVRSLIAKRAIDELPGFSYTDGRTYIIHGYQEILRRRREAGLTHVLRTRGVAFVEPQSGAPQSSAPDSTAPPNLETSAPDSVLAALRRHDPAADEAAAAALWRRCRAVESTATAEEVVSFINLKGGKPIGFLLSAVPRCFQGESFRQFREWARTVLDPATR